jgi:cob(I)alamin adenosyltransferase
MVIYTKRGDKGETSMYDEASTQRVRVSKDSLKVEALGTIDELNSFLGVTISFSNIPEITLYLKEVQRNLLTIGSITAGSKLKFTSLETKKIEKTIDKLEGDLPVLANFILPGGTTFSSHLHYARALCRRTERRMVSLSKVKREKVRPQILIYLNRLSDYLFMLGRYAVYEAKLDEEVWVGKKTK